MLPHAGSSGGSYSILSLIICYIVNFVDGLMPFLIRCMWPIIAIEYFGRCFHTAVVVNPGQIMNQSFAMALIQGVAAMLTTHAWR